VLFCFSFIALGAHLGLMLGVGRLLGLSRQELLLASNANIGGERLWVVGACTEGERDTSMAQAQYLLSNAAAVCVQLLGRCVAAYRMVLLTFASVQG
jgi:uncharacterized membrane protein